MDDASSLFILMNRQEGSYMNSKKPVRYFEKIADYKERFRKLTTEAIQLRLTEPTLYKEARIALREVLEERINETTKEASVD